jgi:hypothetical protein
VDVSRVSASAYVPDVETRLATLDEMWQANPSRRTLAEAQRLADEANTEAYKNGTASVRMHAKAAREATTAANVANRELGLLEREVLGVVDELRRTEVAAARAAGAEIGPEPVRNAFPGMGAATPEGPFSFGEDMVARVGQTSGPFGRVEGMQPDELLELSRVRQAQTYTFRGQEYTVPTLQEILQNPQKYIRQFRERSDFFRSITTGQPITRLPDPIDPGLGGALALSYVSDLWLKAKGIGTSINMSGEKLEELTSLMSAWGRDAKTLRAALSSVEQAMKAEQQLGIEELFRATTAVGEVFENFLDRFNSIAALYDDSIDNVAFWDMLRRTPQEAMGEAEAKLVERIVGLNARGSALRATAAQIDRVARSGPAVDAFKGSKSLKGDARKALVRKSHEFVEDTNSMLDEVARNIAETEDGYGLWSTLVRAKLAEGRFLQEQTRLGQAQAALEQAQVPVVVEKIIKPFEKGYQKAAKEYLEANGLVPARQLRMPSYAVNEAAMEVLTSMQRLNDGAVVRALGRFISRYTGFFKAYATLTPGFHVRNAISNVFQLFAGGAEVRNMGGALRLYSSFADTVRDIVRFDEWDAAVKRWMDNIPEADRPAAEIAYRVSTALSGGNVADAFREISQMKQSVLTDNVATRLSRRTGHRVEGSARFIMAFDAAKRGMDFNQSFNHTRRFLFDYHDPSILDETIRNIVPFWTWMSRNLPLQITNQWLNPRPYVTYSKFAKNFRADDREDMPEWMRRQNPLALGGGFVLTPDLPMNNIEKQVNDLVNPGSWLEYANPALRVPIELMAGRKAFSGAPIDGFAPVDGALRPFVPLLEALGQIERGPNGEPVISQSAKYALESLIPTIGQAGRLFPSSNAPEGRQASSVARYFGLPLQAWGPEQSNSEAIGRLRALQELAQRQRQIREASQ